jgi:hypothetical protein
LVVRPFATAAQLELSAAGIKAPAQSQSLLGSQLNSPIFQTIKQHEAHVAVASGSATGAAEQDAVIKAVLNPQACEILDLKAQLNLHQQRVAEASALATAEQEAARAWRAASEAQAKTAELELKLKDWATVLEDLLEQHQETERELLDLKATIQEGFGRDWPWCAVYPLAQSTVSTASPSKNVSRTAPRPSKAAPVRPSSLGWVGTI